MGEPGMQGAAQTARSHQLQPVADVPSTVAIDSLWTVPLIGLILAAIWTGVRGLSRRRRAKRP